MGKHQMTFYVPGIPVPAQRPRENYHTPKATIEYEKRVQKFYLRAALSAGIPRGQEARVVPDGFEVSATFLVKNPCSHKTGDLDNLIKSILDGISIRGSLDGRDLAPWKDDCQVTRLNLAKLPAESEGTWVKISWEEYDVHDEG